MRLATLSALALAFVVAACGGAAPQPSATATAPAAAIAPRPYTPEQIRDAMPVGTDMRYRIEAAGAPATIVAYHVDAADATSVTMTDRVLSEDGAKVIAEEKSTTEWVKLMEHATFPADATTVRDASVEVPAGRFETTEYVVRRDGSVVTFHFAKTLPGPPVSMVEEADGVVKRSMKLVSRK